MLEKKRTYFMLEKIIQSVEIKMFSIVGVIVVLRMSLFSDKPLSEFRSYQILNDPFIYLAPHNIKTILNLT